MNRVLLRHNAANLGGDQPVLYILMKDDEKVVTKEILSFTLKNKN